VVAVLKVSAKIGAKRQIADRRIVVIQSRERAVGVRAAVRRRNRIAVDRDHGALPEIRVRHGDVQIHVIPRHVPRLRGRGVFLILPVRVRAVLAGRDRAVHVRRIKLRANLEKRQRQTNYDQR
jgi:hypothetical protein